MKAEWHDRFFRGLYLRVLAAQFSRSTSLAEARLIKRFLRVKRGRKVLDIPCGMGRITVPLARMGLKMTGMDRQEAYIRRARRNAARVRVRPEFIVKDMRDLDRKGEFDAAFNWFGSFGYFRDRENLEFCRKVFRTLKPGGRFLVEGPNRVQILAHFRPFREYRYAGIRITERVRWDRRGGRVASQWLFQRGRKQERHSLSMWIFGGRQINALLRKAGFRDIRLYDRNTGRGYTRNSRRIAAVGMKPR